TNDIGNYAAAEPRPVVVRGVLEEEPVIVWQPSADPLRSFPRSDEAPEVRPVPRQTHVVLGVTRLKQRDDWRAVSGRAQLLVAGSWQGCHVGDEVEVVGRLVAPHGPANPGEFDYAAHLLDQRVRALVVVQKTSDAVSRLKVGWPFTPDGWLALVRGWGQRTLEKA